MAVLSPLLFVLFLWLHRVTGTRFPVPPVADLAKRQQEVRSEPIFRALLSFRLPGIFLISVAELPLTIDRGVFSLYRRSMLVIIALGSHRGHNISDCIPVTIMGPLMQLL